MKEVYAFINDWYTLNGIEKDILDDLVSEYEDYGDALSWLEDVMMFGCVSGCTKLVYYDDVYDYMHYHMDTIEQIMQEDGYMFDYNNFSFNNVVWFAYELCCSNVYDYMRSVVKDLKGEEW